jgi:hypothetical protein
MGWRSKPSTDVPGKIFFAQEILENIMEPQIFPVRRLKAVLASIPFPFPCILFLASYA